MPVVQDEISLVKVADGRGILGTPVSTYAQSTSGTTPPTTWSATRPNVPAGQYLWTRVVTTYTDNTTSETQTPTLMGKSGESGLGIKEKSINYAAGTSGNTPPTTGWQETIPTVAANQYLWTRTTLVYTDDSKTDAYSVGKMGANGADAQLLYLTASAENMTFNADDTPKTTQTINISAKIQNVTGTATFTAIPYIGNTAQPAITLGGSGNTRTLTSAQWTNKNWTLIAVTATLDNLNDTLSIVKVKDGAKGDKGSDGIAGKDGVGVSDTTITYAQSSNGTNPPSTGWTASVPTLIKGQYLWTKTVWSYTDSTTETGYTVSYNAKDGNDGDDGIAGKDGVGISATKIEYVGSTSGTVKPTTGWSTTIPAVAEGQYLWTRTTWTYTDNTSEMGYSAAKMGAKGDKGDQGATGPKGDQGNQGIQGPMGADGKPSYTHWAYAWSADGKDRFTTTYPGENLLDYSQNPTSARPVQLKGSTRTATETVTMYNGITRQEKVTASTGEFYYRFMSTGDNNIAGTPIEPGETYTFSLDIRASYPRGITIFRGQYAKSSGNWINIEGLGGQIPGITGNFSRHSVTFKVPEDAYKMYFSIQTYGVDPNSPAVGTVVEFQKAKFSVAPSGIYTPAPSEDFANAYPTYAGSYVDSIATDSEDPTKYTWQRILGDDGKDGEKGDKGDTGSKGDKGDTGSKGENGVSVTGTQVQFVQSSSMTEPTTGWSSTRPTPVPSQWLWTRSRNTFSDGTYGAWATVPTLIGREAIVISATAPSNPSTGTLWQTATDPNVKKWDGTKWVDWGISVDNLVAENIVIKDGKFERIEGLEIYGGLIVNSFDVWTGFYVNDTDQLWRKGTTTVANSEVAIDYQNYNKKTGAIIEIGSTVSGVGGNSTAIATPQGVIKRSADFTVNGIELIDDRASGTNTAARMKYSDLIEVATLSITAASGWSQYAASGISHPTASRTGRMVQLSGAFKPNSDIAGSADQVTMSSRLPLWARPKEEITVVQQGSGMSRYRLVVTADGYITMSRYGTSSYATAVKDAYLNISVAYAGADIFQEVSDEQ